MEFVLDAGRPVNPKLYPYPETIKVPEVPVSTTLKSPEEIRELIAQACDRRELLILATPYLRFESSFVALEGSELHALATMSRDDAVYGLNTQDLRIRFPKDLGFVEGQVQMLGLGLREGRRTVRLSLPKLVQESEQRVAYRVQRLGRVEVTLSTPKADLYTSTLQDLSVTGARLHLNRDLPENALHMGDRILVTIPFGDSALASPLRIQTTALVRHFRGRGLGIEFQPELDPALRDPLSRWVFTKREEDRDRLARRLEQGPRSEATRPSHAEMGILFISADAELEVEVRQSLESVRPLIRVQPTAQAVKEALSSKPVLAIFHVSSAGLDERRRLKTLMEIANRRVPALVLGTNLDGAALFELASEWKASSAVRWEKERSEFLRRLVQGMIRRHAHAADGPMLPQALAESEVP